MSGNARQSVSFEIQNKSRDSGFCYLRVRIAMRLGQQATGVRDVESSVCPRHGPVDADARTADW
jgi:hypothetical protein